MCTLRSLPLLFCSFFILTYDIDPPPMPAYSSSTPIHPALNVTNATDLVPLTLEVDKVEYSPWPTLFRNNAKVRSY